MLPSRLALAVSTFTVQFCPVTADSLHVDFFRMTAIYQELSLYLDATLNQKLSMLFLSSCIQEVRKICLH